ncbi:MAG: hypothetical protein ACXV2C_00140 [Candidatus Bathyarchaeia archaeon]
MRVCVTGHTSGLGKAMFTRFAQNDYDVEGLSRGNGLNVEDENTYTQTFSRFGARDIVINNAYCGIGQSMLLLWLSRYYPFAHIINIGSVSADRTDATSTEQISYAANKAHLREVHKHLLRTGYNTTLLELGRCNTDFNKDKPGNKLEPWYVAQFIESIMIPHRRILPTITLEPSR